MFKPSFPKILIAALGLGASQAYAAPLINLLIDDFSTFQEEIVKKKSSVSGPVTCTSFSPSSSSSSCNITHTPGPGIQASGGGILGGYRDLYVSTGSLSGLGTRGTSATSTGSVLEISNDTGVAGTVIVVWDGAHAVTADPSNPANIATAGLGGIDFTLSPGSYGVLLEVFSIDLNVTAALTLWDTAGQAATASHTFSSVSSYVFPFAGPDSFLADNPLLNLDQIGAVRLTLTGPAGWDGQIDLVGVTTIPEPATLSLLGLGLLGVGAAARRQKI